AEATCSLRGGFALPPLPALLVERLLRTLRTRRWPLAAFVVGTLLSLIHAWPLVASGGRVPSITDRAPREDVLMNMWHLHWLQWVLSHFPANPFETHLVAAPTGTTFYWHDLGLAKVVPGAVLGWIVGIGPALNLVTFSTF